jgi:SEC-C motif-containing protein
MRSRYSAYATGNIDYIVDTHDPDRKGEVDRKNTELWSKSSEWVGLEITATEKGPARGRRRRGRVRRPPTR